MLHYPHLHIAFCSQPRDRRKPTEEEDGVLGLVVHEQALREQRVLQAAAFPSNRRQRLFLEVLFRGLAVSVPELRLDKADFAASK